MRNVPRLRFPEFKGEWRKINLESIAPNISAGKDTSKNGIYKLYGSTGVIGTTDIATYKGEIVLVARVGANAGLIQLVNDEFGVTDNTLVVNAHDNNRYIYYYLQHYNLNRLVFGSGQPLITGGMLKKVSIGFSNDCAEKNKIVKLLSLLDKRIATQNKIIEDLKKLKVAISNRLLNNKTLLNKTAPLSKFGDLKNGYAFKSSAYVPNGNYNIITIANVSGDREIVTDNCNTISSVPTDIQSHQVLKSSDILISLTGNVGRVSLNKGNNNLLNQRVGLFVPNNSISSEFLYQTLSFVQFENSMINLAQGAAQLNIAKGDVESYQVRYSENEHLISQITQILLGYDKKIEIENKYLQSLLAQKSYLLSNMFI